MGANLGAGLNLDVGSNITLEAGADYHKVFNGDIDFMHAHTGVIFRF